MKMELTTPCDNCPFRVRGFIALCEDRVIEIAETATGPQGGTFACHKTVEHGDDGEHLQREEEQHCAGALIFAEKQDNPTQLMRIYERFGGYDRTKLKGHDEVWDDLESMLDGHAEVMP
jgi:hypothetical protein